MISIKVFISLRSLKKKKEYMEQVDPVVPYDFFSQLLCVSRVVVLAHPTVNSSDSSVTQCCAKSSFCRVLSLLTQVS